MLDFLNKVLKTVTDFIQADTERAAIMSIINVILVVVMFIIIMFLGC